MRALLLPGALGLLLGLLIPHGTLLKASEEVIAFVSLLMAGLLPAMTLTATVLRGDSFSAARVRDYGERLHRQLMFWGALFGMAALSVLFVTAAKVTDASPPTTLHLHGHAYFVDLGWLAQGLCGLAAAAFLTMLSRLLPAYRSLQALLALSVTMAEAQALANDRAVSDALSAKAARVGAGVQEPKQAEWPRVG